MHGLMLGLPLAALSVCGPAPPVWPARFVLAQRKVPDDRSGNSTVRRDVVVPLDEGVVCDDGLHSQ